MRKIDLVLSTRKMVLHDAESSKVANKRAKKQSLAALPAANVDDERTVGIRISEHPSGLIPLLHDLNITIRRSPRKHVEYPIRTPRKIGSNLGHTTKRMQHTPPSSSILVDTTNLIQPPPSSNTSIDTTNQIQPPPSSNNPLDNTNPVEPHVRQLHFQQTTATSDSSPNELQLNSSEGHRLTQPRKKRGRTMLKSLAMIPDEKPEVEFNECGQELGTNSKHLSSYIGTLAREMVPFTISSWRKVDDNLRDDLWTCIQATSQRFKSIREKNKLPHTMSRKGYARLEEEMKKEKATSSITRGELWCKGHNRKDGKTLNSIIAECISKIIEHHNAASQNSQEGTSVTQDGISKLFGQEHGGRVRGLGFGVVPSQLRIRGNSSGEVHALRNQVSGLETKVHELTLMLMELKEKTASNAGNLATPDPNMPQKLACGSRIPK